MINRSAAGATIVVLLIAGGLAAAGMALAGPASQAYQVQPTPTGRIASEAELAAARESWSRSAHAETFDEGMGANTTCARCKSPRNWDPRQELAQAQALNCGSCKRVPGAPRPALESGVPVRESDWQHITCDICHMPVGDSYATGVVFWNQAAGRYEAVGEVEELCEHCHEGRHGFQVLEEQAATRAHTAMTCTECHGSHGEPSACTDCHDPRTSPGAAEHSRHPSVSCSGCHDAGGLSVWREFDPESPHYGRYITVRFAHTLTSWPSHNLSREVECERCHHPLADRSATLVPGVRCDQCHKHEYGAVSLWCTYFRRDPDPTLGAPAGMPED